jgi:hypothetical protein
MAVAMRQRMEALMPDSQPTIGGGVFCEVPLYEALD